MAALLFLLAMATFFVNFNANGCSEPTKRQDLIQHLKNVNSHIVFLSETHSSRLTEEDWRAEWRGPIVFSHGNSLSGGVATLFSSRLDVDIVSHRELLPGRCMYVQAKIFNFTFNLFNIHAPNVGAERLAFLENLNKFISTLDTDDILVLAGDFNSTLDPALDRKSAREGHLPSSRALQSLVDKHSLVDVWREYYPDKRQYTWSKTGSDGPVSAARLDRLYVSDNAVAFVRDPRILNFSSFRSDHCPLRAAFQLAPLPKSSGHWCLNQSVLDEPDYQSEVASFWGQWQQRKADFSSPALWWEIGKNHIRVISKQYTVYRKARLAALEADLAGQVSYLSSLSDPSAEQLELLAEKKTQLDELYLINVKGACVRTRFHHMHSLTSPTKFFFNMEQRQGSRRTLNLVEREDGTVTESPAEIKSDVVDFYKSLYSKSDTDPVSQDLLLDGLPRVSEESAALLDEPLAIGEFAEALKSCASNKTPGLDGLPYEFYKTFWDVLGQDFFQVFRHCADNGELPTSCTRSVVTLLPKSGNLGLIKNWRPISLLCTDYKIFSKVLSNRLKATLPEIIHPDQTYTVPGRNIFNNLHLMRDCIRVANLKNLPLAVVSLDQEKAFDRVDHGWLLKTLRAFGVGDKFVSMIELLYAKAQCILKINGDLCAPFDFARGIRQGCPLSGSLYAISIEPLLHYVRKSDDIRGFSPDQSVPPVKSSGYADDVDSFITRDSEFVALTKCIDIYERASSAKVNFVKSEGLWCGSWRGRQDAPLNLRWNSEGLKCLGVFLGNTEAFEQRNWEGLLEAAQQRLSVWKPLFRHLSIKGRVVLVNSLAASKLWHKLQVLTPPKPLLRNLQKYFIDIIWCEGKHWLRQETLALHPSDGGLGLADIAVKLSSFRAQYIRDVLLSSKNHSSAAIATYIAKCFLELDYSHHWLSCRPSPEIFTRCDRAFLPLKECLDALGRLDVEETASPDNIGEAPIFFNPLIKFDLTPRQSLLYAAGVTKLHQLVTADGSVVSAELLHRRIPNKSLRLLEKEINLLLAALPEGWCRAPRCSPGRAAPKDLGIADRFDPDRRLSLDDALLKHIYYAACRNSYSRTAVQLPGHKWKDALLSDRLPNFSVYYKFPIPADVADVQWRVAHGAVANALFRYNAGFAPSPDCPFCGLFGDLIHTFINCTHLNDLAKLVRDILFSLNPSYVFEIENYIFLHPNTKTHGLPNLVFAVSKSATYKALSCRNFGEGPTDPVVIFKSSMRKIILNHYLYSKLAGQVTRFELFWCPNEALCKLDDTDALHFSPLLS